MEHDVIAYLYPHGLGVAGRNALEAIMASSRYMPPRLAQPSRTRHSRRSRRERESTEPPENAGASELDYLPTLVVRFSDAPRTKKGLVFGSNPNCDVVLDIQGVSNVHFSLTFDDYNRPIIEDLGSLMGTQVTYDGDGEGVRSGFRWIVGGHRIPDEMESIIITVPDAVAFQIVVKRHELESPAYIGAVAQFKQGAATTEGRVR